MSYPTCCIYTVLVYYIQTMWKCRRPRNRGSIPSRSKKFFSYPKLPDRLRGPFSLIFKGYYEQFLRGVKRPGREAEHSPPSSAEIKNEWSYTPTASYAFVACKRKTFFLLYWTWKFNIYCAGVWENCENGHADVSERIYAIIMLFTHVQWKVTKLSWNVGMLYHFVPADTIQICGGSNTVCRFYGFSKNTSSVPVCVLEFGVSGELSVSII